MTAVTSRGVKLCGTDESGPTSRLLRAGPLSVELENGNLRYVRFAEIEVLRGIAFLVRDENWGTFTPTITDLDVEDDDGAFRASYRGACADAKRRLVYTAEIVGRHDGSLAFTVVATAETDFETNRTGFVVLHPLAGVAGRTMRVVHTDRREETGRFPELIKPSQPVFDIRSLAHEIAPGAWATCTMEGDAFEMEDQRNWSDASYKTYVRPLALPWPYTIEAGSNIEQRIILTIEGEAAEPAAEPPVTLRLGPAEGKIPPLGMGLDPDDAEAALGRMEALGRLGIAHLVCHHDPRRGHGRSTLARQVEVARAMGAEPWLEAVIVSVDGFEEEVAALGALAADLGQPFATILLSPASDLKCTLPGSVWPKTPPAPALFEAARRAFPGKRLGGGMFSYFTELNRKRPPSERLDVVGFTTSTMVHAGDDRSVIETLQALPAIARSAKIIAAGKPLAVGPSAIGMRDNPYGEAVKQNPGNIRQAMNWNDPRQRGLLGAAWNLGYFARLAEAGISAVALGAPVGPFGAASAESVFPQPWYDTHEGVYPVYHVLRGLARLRGRTMLRLDISRTDRLLGLAVETNDGLRLWLANLGPEPLTVDLGMPIEALAVLDAESFVAAAGDSSFMDKLAPHSGGMLVLDSYAVAHVKIAHNQQDMN